MRLEKLLQGVSILRANCDIAMEITSVATDSGAVCPGCAFICIRGARRDGNSFIPDAVSAGAAVIISDEDISKFPVQWVRVADSRSAAAMIWSNFYGNPGDGMKIAAITGTNGKTSVAYALYGILRRCGISTGLIGTVDCMVDGESIPHSGGSSLGDIPSAMTTPDPGELYGLLNAIHRKKATAAVLEASSHALHQKRLDGMHVDVGVFTNLSPEHLDYHGSMEEYFRCKAALAEKCSVCAVNIDDPWGRRLADSMSCCSVRCSTVDSSADVYSSDISFTDSGVSFTIRRGEESAAVDYPAWGDYSVYNGMLAIAAAVEMGVPFEEAAHALSYVSSAPGRMERVGLPEADFSLYIDYAHTPAALESLLHTVRRFTPKNGRLVLLFGCGGDRDSLKRPVMGGIAARLADHTVITSDNCRSENRDIIISDIIKGISGGSYEVITDRREAIMSVVTRALPGDVIVLAGKGHERYEIDAGGKHPFDEREIVREAYSIKMDKRAKG